MMIGIITLIISGKFIVRRNRSCKNEGTVMDLKKNINFCKADLYIVLLDTGILLEYYDVKNV